MQFDSHLVVSIKSLVKEVFFIHLNMLKVTILAISIITIVAGSFISPALGLMEDAFNDTNTTTIKLILIIQAVTIIPFSFLSGYLTKFIQQRTIVIIGLIAFLIGGVGPHFFPAIKIIMIFRLVLGIGVGLVIPMAMTLINNYFTGAERTKMMGYQSAFNNFSGIVALVVSGWLATLSWKTPFLLYFITLVILVLAIFFIPKNEIQQQATGDMKKKLPLKVYGYTFAIAGIMLVYYTIHTNIALYLKESQLGGAQLAGIVAACTTIGGIITNMTLVPIQIVLKRYVLPTLLMMMALAFFILFTTQSISLIIISVGLVGLAQGGLFPLFILKALDSVPPELAPKTVAWTSSFTYVGMFLSPLVMDFITFVFRQENVRFQYGVLAISVFVFATCSYAYIFRKTAKQKQLSSV